MKEDNKLEKIFNWTRLGVKIIAVIMLLVCLKIYSSSYFRDGISGVILSFAVPSVFFIIFLFYNSLSAHFYKKGFYTSKQATEFYKECEEQNISSFQEEHIEKVKDIYFAIFGTDKYIGSGTLLAHMEEIYNVGKNAIEDSEV